MQTAKDVLMKALSYFDEDNLDDYKRIGMTAINTVLSETKEINDGLREKKGLEPLKEAPVISTLSDEVPYETELIERALIFGLAAHMYWKDGDADSYAMFNERYVNACNSLSTVEVVAKWRI